MFILEHIKIEKIENYFKRYVHNSWFLKALTIYDIQSIHSGNKNNNSDKPLKASNDHEIQAHDECM